MPNRRVAASPPAPEQFSQDVLRVDGALVIPGHKPRHEELVRRAQQRGRPVRHLLNIIKL